MENAKPAIGDQVLKFLAEKHPDDEKSLESLTELLEKADGITDERIIELAYKGQRYDDDIEAARQKGYVEGKNEKIELEVRRRAESVPVDDGGSPNHEPDLPLLRHMRRSVWDD